MTHSYQTSGWAPYGAFELKAHYQRNLLIGQFTVISIITLILLTAWLYPQAPTISVPVGDDPIGSDSVVVVLGPPISVVHSDDPFGTGRPEPPENNRGMIPVPIPDGERELDVMIPTRRELAEMVGAGSLDSGVMGGNYQVDTTYDYDYIPRRCEFVPVEIYPEMIYNNKPAYPRFAKVVGAEGVVVVQALISKEGTVLEAVVGKSSGTASLDDAAIQAAYKCRFKPGIQNGRPVACWVTYKVEFKLR